MEKLKQDDILTLHIDGYGMEGEGVAHADEYVIFVPFALPHEQVRAKVTYVKKNLVFCSLQEVTIPSPLRVTPECNRFPKCGGCDMLHISYREQLRIKKENVQTLLHKNAGIDMKIDDTVPCSSPLGYRNKVQLPFGVVNGKVAMGFFKENSHKIVSITKCFLHGEWVEKLIKVFLAFAESYHLSAYDDNTRKGLLRHMVARYIDGKYCIVVVTNHSPLPHADGLLRLLDAELGSSDCYSLYYSPKEDYNNVILGKTVVPIRENPFLCDILGITVSLNPFSFLQLNNEIRDKIYQAVIDKIPEKGVVIDAYAGVGILGAVLAKRGARVYNIEIVPEATRDGDKLAKANHISSAVQNINGDSALCLPPLLAKLAPDEDISIILDPPRKGIAPEVASALNGLTNDVRLFYISCNPSTLTRDLKLLSERYEILSVTPYDMFPNTKHVETLVVLHSK